MDPVTRYILGVHDPDVQAAQTMDTERAMYEGPRGVESLSAPAKQTLAHRMALRRAYEDAQKAQSFGSLWKSSGGFGSLADRLSALFASPEEKQANDMMAQRTLGDMMRQAFDPGGVRG